MVDNAEYLEALCDACADGDVDTVRAFHLDPEGPSLNT
jgi:hypothetical protein